MKIKDEIPYILSLAYRDQIDKICLKLPRLGLKYFVMYIIFNNGSCFVLSNIYHHLFPYYYEGYYKHDYSFKPEIINGINYYLCDKTPSVSSKFKEILENKFSVYRAYYIVRRSPECTFVFGAMKDKIVDRYNEFYSRTIDGFENFCIEFVDHFICLIKHYNPSYRNSFILTNDRFRSAVIKEKYPEKEKLTSREKECLNLASRGKSAKQIAKILSISPLTVEQHYKNIREKFNCGTLVEAVVEGIHRGVIGEINPQFQIDESKLKGFKIVEDMYAANMEISKTNLALLNRVKSDVCKQ